ncbi:hypothetical protein LXL04_005091 [Taraxacum kok-saghyz]
MHHILSTNTNSNPQHFHNQLLIKKLFLKLRPRWDRTTSCGAHPRINKPLPLVLSSNPSSSIHCSIFGVLGPARTTQINGLLHDSRAKASSTSWSGSIRLMLPRHA